MKIYLVWVQASYCDYGVVNVLESKERAEEFIKEEGKNFVTHYSTITENNFYIEEREIGVPVTQEF